AHQPRKLAPVRGPSAHLELVEAAIESQANVEAAALARGDEHLALQGRCEVPGRLAARRGVHGEQQASARSRRTRRHLAEVADEAIDVAGGRWLWRCQIGLASHDASLSAQYRHPRGNGT